MDIASESISASPRKPRSATPRLFQYYSGDTTYGLNPFNSWPLSNGTPVSFGTFLVQQRKSVQRTAQQRDRQSHVQRLFRLQPVPAREHFHSDRAVQPEIVVSEMAGFQWSVPVQPCAIEHPVHGDFQRLTSRTASLGYNTTGQQFQRQVELCLRRCLGDLSCHRQASPGGDFPLPRLQCRGQLS